MIVDIFYLPLSEQQVEGQAKLIQRQDTVPEYLNGRSVQEWAVCFLVGNFVTHRTILQ